MTVYLLLCGLIKGISPKVCILCVRVKINKRSFEPFCVWMKIPLFKKKYSGQRSFSYQGLVTWNNLPFSIRHTQTYSSFKLQLKTHLSSQTFQYNPFSGYFLIFYICMIIMMFFVFDLQSWDVSMFHVLLHCMSGLHWLFRDVCMLACALLLALDRLVYACFMYWFWCPFLFWIVKCFEQV